MPENFQIPFSFNLYFAEQVAFSKFDNHITRRLSAMQGQYLDQGAYQALLTKEDRLLYEVYEIRRPETAGELLHGLSILHPGRVGREYFMTKGHYHTVLETAELYLCLRGQGYMVMETPEGAWAVERLYPQRILYVPPRWAHRSVNTSPDQDLVTFFVYPGNSGHNYGAIEQQGFRKLVVEENGLPAILDNPRWQPPEAK